MRFTGILFCIGLALIISLEACKEEESPILYSSKGEITGIDAALCACCGGYMIVIDNDSIIYRFNTLPSHCNLHPQVSDFPSKVKLNWELESDCNGIKWIKVIEIDYDN